MKVERLSNIELLRILAMLFVVLHHIVCHGMKLYEPPVTFIERTAIVFDAFLVVGVNLFVLISGYFSIKLSWKSFLNLALICIFFRYFSTIVNLSFASKY